MNNCLHCNKPLTHVEGRKKKSFCGANCRNKYFYQKSKNKRLEKMPIEDLSVKVNFEPTSEENIKKKYGDFIKEGTSEKPQVEKTKPVAVPDEFGQAGKMTAYKKHPLWKEGDPKEGSMAFYLKYDCYTYSELENKSK